MMKIPVSVANPPTFGSLYDLSDSADPTFRFRTRLATALWYAERPAQPAFTLISPGIIKLDDRQQVAFELSKLQLL